MGKYFIIDKVSETEITSGAGEAKNITYSRKQTKIKNMFKVVEVEWGQRISKKKQTSDPGVSKCYLRFFLFFRGG